MKTIGRVDKADFPELLLSEIDIKIDTGAYTSSIHTHHIREIVIDGEDFIEFQLMDPTHPEYHDKVFKTKRYKRKSVKNSFGKAEERFIVETTIVIFGEEYPIELSLSERSDMKYPVLIGRKLLNRRFIVDTSKKYLSFKLNQKKSQKLNK